MWFNVIGLHYIPIPPIAVSKGIKKPFFNHITALLYAIFHKIMLHKIKRIKRKKCSWQAVAVHGPLVFYILVFLSRRIAISVKLSQLGGDAPP